VIPKKSAGISSRKVPRKLAISRLVDFNEWVSLRGCPKIF
jgi:hypothetical protein